MAMSIAEGNGHDAGLTAPSGRTNSRCRWAGRAVRGYDDEALREGRRHVVEILFIDTHVHFYDLQHPRLQYGWL
jgi:hypothetical protein